MCALLFTWVVEDHWRVVASLFVSVLWFFLCVAAFIASYLFLSPKAAYIFAGLSAVMYGRRYVQARSFRKGRDKVVRAYEKIRDLHREVEGGEYKYNTEEVIRRFREIEAEDIRLPSIFVSVIRVEA